MSAKENAAVNELLELLESRYALRVLWALKDGHPQTFRLLQDSIGSITPNTLNTRIKELRAAGLLGHGTNGYTVTTLGADLLKRLNDLQAFAGKMGGQPDQSQQLGQEEIAIGHQTRDSKKQAWRLFFLSLGQPHRQLLASINTESRVLKRDLQSPASRLSTFKLVYPHV